MKTYTARKNTEAVVQDQDGAIIGPENTIEWAAYLAWRAEGNTPAPFAEERPPVPPSVPLWAVRVILAERGLLEAAKAAIAASDNPAAQAIWEYGNTVDRGSPALLALAETLGVAGELDDLFIAAGDLRV